jgi:two-component system KDP operon response regulator KdpE
MANGNRILVVDDEPQITRVLRTALSTHKYDVRVANDGPAAIDALKEWTPDLVITDVSMPKMTGIELCRQIRLQFGMPIIVLSIKGEEQSKIAALDAGADDYVTKPFSMNELLARIRANLRRRSSIQEESDKPIHIGSFQVDPQAHRVTIQNREVRLTPKEFELLACFVRNAGKVLTHRAILSVVWGPNSVEQPEQLRVLVGQLRKKIDPTDPPRYILTEPWVGYRFDPGA